MISLVTRPINYKRTRIPPPNSSYSFHSAKSVLFGQKGGTMADGQEIRADIDTETVRGLQLILGGSAAGLLAALPHVLETPRVSALASWMVAGTACFAVGLVLTVVHNRFRRKCSLQYSRE